MTRARLRQMVHSSTDLPLVLVQYYSGGLADVLNAVGWKGSRTEAYEIFTTNFAERLTVVIDLALRLNKAIGEDITSGDLIATAIPPDVDFDPSTMEDINAEGSRSKPKDGKTRAEGVLCTIGLGLGLVKKSGGENIWEERTLMKPSVVLESSLSEMEDDNENV